MQENLWITICFEWDAAFQTADWWFNIDSLLGSMYLSMKGYLKNIIWQNETESWVATKFLYPELDLYYSVIDKISINVWWRFTAFHPDYVKRVSCVMAVMMGTEPQCFQCNFNCKVCRLCCANKRDNALHVLYECPQLLSTRGSAWLEVINSMPDAMTEHIRGRTDHDKLIFILSGLKGGYIREWQDTTRE